ncbi:alpha/beta fold hydrolase [Clostridium taeniosporum]|uniref:Alpha/beta hydrolase n=1 Tax=Clostridium taeniosporum TaxID=394958 RepID=A0A1D7XGS9_9CLOT|nr:alpha/beta hydrolase [Clostridium taeniosporum]AOR22565.1 alpha/beta hydrolase [Clostridium taeniosporum]
MNLLPHSNGFQRIKPPKFNLLDFLRKSVIIIIVFLIIGFLVQSMSNFIANETLKANLKYVRIETRKLEYKIKGTGSHTVVFDGGIGSNIYEWDEVCKKLERDYDVKTFVYNREGYGFSDSGERRSPEEQAEDLKNLLKKSGANEPYIFVSEEYGSLISMSFAEKYPELVGGLVLINPLSYDLVNSKEYSDSIKWQYYKSKLRYLGSYFYITELCDKLGILKSETDIEDLPKGAQEEINIHKNKKNYTKAIYDEIGNLYKKDFKTDINKIIETVPTYLISNEITSEIENIPENSLLTVYKSSILSTPYALHDQESIIDGVNNILKKAKRLEKINS